MGREIGGTRADDAAIRCEPARGERRVTQVGDAHRDVEAFVHHVDIPVGEAERKLNLRIALGEFRYERRDVLVAEGCGQCHLECAPRFHAARGDLRICLLDVGEHARARLVVAAAFDREVQRPRGSIDKPHAKA